MVLSNGVKGALLPHESHHRGLVKSCDYSCSPLARPNQARRINAFRN